MKRTMLRQWRMLSLIPRGRGVAASQLRERLAQEGYKVSLRTLQEELVAIAGAEIFPLKHDGHRPRGWSWEKDVSPMEVHGMGLDVAVLVQLAGKLLRGVFPRAVRARLEPLFAQSRGVLAELHGGAFVDKIRILGDGPLRARTPEISAEVLDTVLDGLYRGHKLRVTFAGGRVHEVNPLGLVARGQRVYLVVNKGPDRDAWSMLLHRIIAVERDPDRTDGGEFDLDAWLHGGGLAFSRDPARIDLVLDFREDVKVLAELSLGEGESVEEREGGWRRLTVDVANTRSLENWLLGFGAAVRVVAPDDLVQRVADRHRRAAALYEEGSAGAAEGQ